MLSIAAAVRKDGVVMLNPGAVRVEKHADLEFSGMPPTPVDGTDMIKVIDKLTIADSARLLQHDGKTQASVS